MRREILLALGVVLGALGGTAQAAPCDNFPLLDDHAIHLKSVKSVKQRRQVLIDTIWGAGGMPAPAANDGLPASNRIVRVAVAGQPVDLPDLSALGNLVRVDRLDIRMEGNERTHAYHLVP